ncbi:uncharacterized protein BKCO1_1000608 [Diplodia corticola]|uniref:Ankyrin repeat protein n=1 Tax=Diplodia corticola TaxID=236234 RepID=A0A1J9SJV5_9PEZI|nr:uncharacterized protein BKCO1_1000608 [Diplodia corticola]OJD40623.1 hypothetical protein BKCO1_1000608 [Diplodia corticola]
MADPFSTAAAAISLVDVALKSAREIHSLIPSLRDAPKSLCWAFEVVCEVQILLQDFQNLVDAYRSSSMPHVSPQSLSSILRLVQSISEDLITLRAEAEEPIFNTDSRRRRILKSLRLHKKESSINKTCSRIERNVKFTHASLSALGRNNDLFQIGQLRTANENTKLVIHGQTQLRGDTLDIMHRNSAVSQQILTGQHHTHVEMLEGHAQLHADILAVQNNQLQNLPPILLHEGSAADAAATLSLVHRLLPSVLERAPLPGTTMADLTWMENELRNNLSGVHLLAASELKQGLSLVPYGTRRTTQPIALQILNHWRSQSSSVMQRGQGHLRKQKLESPQNEEMEIVVQSPEGNLFVWVSDGCEITVNDFSTSFKGFRVMFMPNQTHGLPGLSASFVEASGNGLKVSSSIRTFGIVPAGCAIIKKIWGGDTDEVRAILQRGECSAADRDKHGWSLLGVAVYKRRYDICYLLIRYGADPLDCTPKGDTALDIFIGHWDLADEDVHFEDYIRLFATSGCFECDQMNELFNSLAEPLGFFPSPPQFGVVSNLEKPMANPNRFQFLLNHILDIQEVGTYGQTLLIECADTHFSNMVPLGRLMLQAGVDVRSFSRHGQGVLHHYLHRLSCCGFSTLRGQFAEDMVLFLQELLSRGASPRDAGVTSPTETALTPAAWVVWCQALDRSGIDIEDLLRAEDELNGLQPPSAEDVEELVGDIAGPNLVAPELLSDERPQGTCLRCEAGLQPVYYRPPFDSMFGLLIESFHSHETRTRHRNGLPCSNLFGVDSCVYGDHDEGGGAILYTTQLSERKWAAYRLWKDGWLATPEGAEFWATDVMTQEAFDSFHHLSAIRL